MSDDYRDRLVRMETKLDFLVNSQAEAKAFQAVICADARKERIALFARVDSLQKFKTWVLGAWAVIVIICGVIYDIWKTRNYSPHP